MTNKTTAAIKVPTLRAANQGCVRILPDKKLVPHDIRLDTFRVSWFRPEHISATRAMQASTIKILFANHATLLTAAIPSALTRFFGLVLNADSSADRSHAVKSKLSLAIINGFGTIL